MAGLCIRESAKGERMNTDDLRLLWEALVSAVAEYDKVAGDADIYDYWAMEEIAAQQGMVSEAAIAYVHARQGGNE